MKRRLIITKFIFPALSLVIIVGLLACGPSKGTAEWYLDQGNELCEEGYYDEAIEEYNKAIELDPNLAEAYQNRAYAYNYKGQYDLTITDCNKAIELDPNMAEAYFNRGGAYIGKGQVDLGIADYTKAIELDPEDQRAYANRVSVEQLITIAQIQSGIDNTTGNNQTDGDGIQTKTLTGDWIDTNPTPGNWGFIMNDQGDPTFLSGSTWYYDCFLDIKENADGTFTTTMDRTLRQITGPVTSIPEIMQQVGNSQTCTVTGKHDGTTMDLLFGELTLHLTLEGDHLYGDTYFYDTGSPIGQFKGLTDVRPSTGEYITWVYSINLKRK